MFDISLYDLQEGNVTRLTSDPGNWEIQPSWSPDGLGLVYTVRFFDGSDNSDIFTMNRAEVKREQLTDTAIAETFPSWSPLGDRIAFLSKEEAGAEDLSPHVMAVDCSSRKRLSELPARGPMSWSPDGNHIACTASKNSGTDIFILEVDTGEGHLLTDSPAPHHTTPAFSPDGRYIAFASATESHAGLMVVDLVTGTMEEITANPGPGSDAHPSWEPKQ